MKRISKIKKIFFGICLLLIGVIVFLFIPMYDISDVYYVKEVREIPKDFIAVDEVYSRDADILYFEFFGAYVVYLDLDFVQVFSTPIEDYSFIVRYDEKLYIDGIKYEEILAAAKSTAEKRNREYYIGELVDLSEVGYSSYSAKVESMQVITIDGKNICEIKLELPPDTLEKDIIKYISHIETESGEIYKPSSTVNKLYGVAYNNYTIIELSTIHLELPMEEKISVVVLKNPESKNYICRVKVD